VPSIAEKSLQSLEAYWEVLVERRDGFGPAGTQKRPVDFAVISEVEVSRRVYE
jgi:hypothetical protein